MSDADPATESKMSATITSEKYYERYGGMPIAPVLDNMELFKAGAISIGVEFRVLSDEVIASLGLSSIAASNGYPTLDDNGVSLHVFVANDEGNYERLRFDCFTNDPHYHYLSVAARTQDVIHIDRTVTGDPVHWALTMLRTRLVPMLLRAEVQDAAALVDPREVEAILPLVTEAAFRARYHSDRGAVAEAAKNRGEVVWDTGSDRSWAGHSSL